MIKVKFKGIELISFRAAAKYFKIDPKHVIIMLPASPGLSVYYEGILNKIEGGTERIPLGDHINEDDIYDDLLEDLEPESKIIH